MPKGNGYLGSGKIVTSKKNQQLVPAAPSHWSTGYTLKKIHLENIEECTIEINGTTEILLRAGNGFQIDYNDLPIHSLIIKEAGIQYNFAASY